MLGVYSAIPNEPSGCFYYRVEVPLRGLTNLGLGQAIIDRKGREVHPEIRILNLMSSDIILLYASSGSQPRKIIELVQAAKPGWNDTRTEMIYPPNLVFDIDDNLDYVHPFNAAFVNLGTRNYDGYRLNPGDTLTATLADGTTVPIWEDKKTVREGQLFDIEANHYMVADTHRVAKSCEGVTVPSNALVKYYKEEIGCKNIYLFPNSVIPEDYPKARLAPRDDGKVRILWQGGGSHMIDWFPLRDAVREVAEKYPNTEWVMWGATYPWIFDNIPPAQVELVPWIGYGGYKAHRTLIDCDINLCPLTKNIFNEAKSCIKWYEGSVITTPEATLASNTAPYNEEMIDGETGLLFDNPKEFVEKISILIENAELRRKLGEGAKKWILDNRHYEKTVPGLHEFYQELRARKRAESLVEA